jgi:hypothetical protein
MAAFHEKHGHYSGAWQELDIMFVMPRIAGADPGVRPRPDQDAYWRPAGCHYTYVIQFATKTTFLLQAIAGDGSLEYELEPGMDQPRQVQPIPMGPL